MKISLLVSVTWFGNMTAAVTGCLLVHSTVSFLIPSDVRQADRSVKQNAVMLLYSL